MRRRFTTSELSAQSCCITSKQHLGGKRYGLDRFGEASLSQSAAALSIAYSLRPLNVAIAFDYTSLLTIKGKQERSYLCIQALSSFVSRADERATRGFPTYSTLSLVRSYTNLTNILIEDIFSTTYANFFGKHGNNGNSRVQSAVEKPDNSDSSNSFYAKGAKAPIAVYTFCNAPKVYGGTGGNEIKSAPSAGVRETLSLRAASLRCNRDRLACRPSDTKTRACNRER
jgi:hypothetical protein